LSRSVDRRGTARHSCRVLEIDPLRDGVTPAPAATVVVVRDASGGPEVLLVQRHRATAFMGGAFVFPGGRVEASDGDPTLVARVGGLDTASAEARLAEPGLGATASALFVAAIRETLEEAGVLLTAAARNDAAEVRAALNGGASFGALAAERGLSFDAARLVPLSRWVTPAVERKRFDARFFLAKVDPNEVASHDAHETIASRWAHAGDAVRSHLAGEIDLPPPTLRTLELLSDFGSADAMLATARAATPPLVRPVFHDLSGAWILALPGDAEHPEKSPVIAGTTRFVCRDARWYSI
jgi:8-oxo-dGTP pyrophosphatase MutT (NUDIX family)